MKGDRYDFKKIEEKWQKRWWEERVFEVSEDPGKKKYYCLEMLPYPSGDIHMGHVRNYSIGDVIARYFFMKGYNVLHPIGWDALGLPAENAAIKHGIHPAEWTMKNIERMRGQLRRLGFSYAWEREVNTSLPDYYRWNQWFFLKMWERGLVYRKLGRVNWCPSCQTVLANEQVEGGRCWRCDSEVEERELPQWFFRITAYAEELLADIDTLKDWPERVKTMQRNWIGKSVGARISFPVSSSDIEIEVFTTRIDTIYGATFLLLSPEHPVIPELVRGKKEESEVLHFVSRERKIPYFLRKAETLEKEGVFTGAYAVNPFSGERIPIFVANYILMDYGTGAVMAVPAHDERDFEFARKYQLPIRIVVKPKDGELAPEGLEKAFTEYGVLIDSGEFSGLSSEEAIARMTEYAEEKGFGKRSVDYRLKDWGISRQRYWGTPIPMIHCPKCGVVPVPYEDLPVVLPRDVEFSGVGGNPLDKVPEFVETTCPKCGGKAKRETDTMDTFVDSSWYFIRYTDPKIEDAPINVSAASYWLPVDIYIGGVEHAVMHLLYFRFFTKVLRDLGFLEISEPAVRLLTQGMVIKDGAKMSKSKGNVVDPDEMIDRYGADTVRLFILFAAPPERDLEWSDFGVEGAYRFLIRVWRLVNRFLPELEKEAGGEPSPEAVKLRRKLHQTIKRVMVDIEERLHFNTAISAIMELVNEFYDYGEKGSKTPGDIPILKEALESLVLILSPFAPHIAEELWERMGHKESLAHHPFPSYDPELAKEELITIVVQVNGKLRGRLEVAEDTSEEEIKELALSLPKVRSYVEGSKVRRVVYVPKKLINIVV